MGIGAQNHAAALRQHLSGVLVDDCLMRGHVDSAVLLRAGQPEHVVIFVDSAAHRAQGIVTVCEHVGHGEFLQARCPCCLDDAYESDVVAGQLVEPDFQLLHIAGGIVVLQYSVADCLL